LEAFLRIPKSKATKFNSHVHAPSHQQQLMQGNSECRAKKAEDLRSCQRVHLLQWENAFHLKGIAVHFEGGSRKMARQDTN